MNCEDADRFLDAYVDGELEAGERSEFEEHLAGCAGCDEKIEGLRRFRSFFAANAPRYPAPPDLRAKVLARLEVEKRPNIIALVRQPWLYAAALLVVSLSLAWFLLFPDQDKRIANEALANYQRASLLEHLCDVVSPDPGVVKPWLTGKLDFSPPVVLPGMNFQMRGGRLDVLQNRKVAALTYKRNKDLVTIFVWPGAGKSLPEKSFSIAGNSVCVWTTAGMNFVAVANMSDHDLDEVVDRMKDAIGG
jgi:anti-sigma factor RsiW